MRPDTGTVCPFPLTTPDPLIIPQDVSECTITYAEAIGPLYFGVRGMLLTVMSLASLIMAYRIWAFKQYAAKFRVHMLAHPMFAMIVLALLFDLLAIVASIDMFGFAGIIPVEAYTILDEVCASLAFSNAIMTVDLYHRLTKSLHTNAKRRRATIVRNVTIIAVWLNFIGFAVLMVTDSFRYELYQGLKSVCGSLILFSFMILSTLYVKELLSVLGFGLEHAANRTSTEAQMSQLKRKHSRFLLVLGIASLALFVNGIMSLTKTDQRWYWPIAESPDMGQIAIRFVFVAYVLLQMYLFRVPHYESSSSVVTTPSDNSKSGGVPRMRPEATGGQTSFQNTSTLVTNNQVAPVLVVSMSMEESQT